MGSFSGPEIINNDLVFAYDMSNTLKSWKGKPTTNLSPNLGIINIQAAPTLAYVGIEDGWKKYSLNGTWTAGTYPYSIGISGVTFTGGVTYSSGVFIKTNVPAKFANLFGGMNYVNEPMNNAGTSFSVPQSDGSFYVGRTGFQYTSTTAQTGYILSQPVIGQVFSSATDFVYIKEGQVETGSFPTPFTSGTRSDTQAVLDLVNKATITAISPTYNSNGTFSFSGGTDRMVVSTVGGSGAFNNHFTISAWINSTNISATQNIVSENGPYFMRIDGSKVRFNVLAGSTPTWLFRAGTTTLSSNTWYFLTMVWDGTANTWTGYINNQLEFSDSKTGPLYGNTNAKSFTPYIGYTPVGGEQSNFLGQISALYYYNRALTAAEVQQNFNALRGRFGI